MALVEVARFYDVYQASLARARLAAEDVETILFDTQMNWGGLDGVVPVRLMADAGDAHLARTILARPPDQAG